MRKFFFFATKVSEVMVCSSIEEAFIDRDGRRRRLAWAHQCHGVTQSCKEESESSHLVRALVPVQP